MATERPRAGQHTGARRIREWIIKRDVLLAAQTPSASLKHLFVLKSEVCVGGGGVGGGELIIRILINTLLELNPLRLLQLSTALCR